MASKLWGLIFDLLIVLYVCMGSLVSFHLSKTYLWIGYSKLLLGVKVRMCIYIRLTGDPPKGAFLLHAQCYWDWLLIPHNSEGKQLIIQIYALMKNQNGVIECSISDILIELSVYPIFQKSHKSNKWSELIRTICKCDVPIWTKDFISKWAIHFSKIITL